MIIGGSFDGEFCFQVISNGFFVIMKEYLLERRVEDIWWLPYLRNFFYHLSVSLSILTPFRIFIVGEIVSLLSQFVNVREN